ncbi:hypothetical protein B0H14DRAFT_3863111 [Mycena olivaceomarginata]|nr:hypothetical protein B0H14DRAFT_3863111 [Mycena olivaceomarginata]
MEKESDERPHIFLRLSIHPDPPSKNRHLTPSSPPWLRRPPPGVPTLAAHDTALRGPPRTKDKGTAPPHLRVSASSSPSLTHSVRRHTNAGNASATVYLLRVYLKPSTLPTLGTCTTTEEDQQGRCRRRGRGRAETAHGYKRWLVQRGISGSSLIVPPSLIYPSSFPALAYTPHAAIYPRADNRWHLLPCLREAHGCRCVAVCVRVESLRAALQILRCSQTADARGPEFAHTRTCAMLVICTAPYLLPPTVSSPTPVPTPPLLLPTHIASHLLSELPV